MNTATDDDRLIVPIEDARRLLGGIGLTKTYELINSGEVVQVSIGRRSFVTRRSIEDYVERHRKVCA